MNLHTSYLEISRSALKHNIAFLKNIIDPDVQISSVVKGNAYGHGIETFIPLAQECGLNHFSVFSSIEAKRVLDALTKPATILIMGWIDNADIAWAIRNEIEFYVFDFDRLENALKFAKKENKAARIHLEVETGMHRTGFSMEDFRNALEILKNNYDHLNFSGLCTHFAGAEERANDFRIQAQLIQFKEAIEVAKSMDCIPQKIHAACSAAALRYPETQYDLVRLGIVQYGFFPNKEVLVEFLTKKKMEQDPLERLVSWKSKVMDVKNVKAGEYVGYGTTFLAEQDMKVATVPVGYSNGFSRALSNKGRVLIAGKRLNVIGIVNMNMIMVDISSVPQVKKEEEVVLIGRQGENEITVSSFSEFSHLVDYELLTRIPENIPRYITD